MLKILEFIFSSFWTFLGTYILLELIVEGIVRVTHLVIRKKLPKENED